MTIVQTQLPELEYDLLRKRARSEGRPLQEVVRDAIRSHVMADVVNPDEPIFTAFPPRKGRKGSDRTSERVDELLYGKRS
jgi:hypothetical protein